MGGEIEFDEDDLKEDDIELPSLGTPSATDLSDAEQMRRVAEAVGPLPHESGAARPPATRAEEIRAGGFTPLNVGSMPGLLWDEVREWGDSHGLVNDKEILYHFIRHCTGIDVPDYVQLHGRRPIPSAGVRKKLSRT